MLIKKRQVLTATLVIALFAALAVNWYFTKPQSDVTLTTGADEAVTGNLGDTLFVAGTTVKNDDGTTEEEATESELVNKEVKTETESAEASEYFSQAKLKRTQAYDEVVANIEKMISQENLSSAEKNKITVMLSDYQNDMKVQTDAENLISAKTGNECMVIINGDNCQVILEKNTLNDTLILQITEIIEKKTDIFSENLTIIELK
ncbi:MAG: SpoIIIAH-like family protein [Ruminococcaceae bacterium]|nr:SpoIIIAH-like family protein [Oscillospiraceae bacterium]